MKSLFIFGNGLGRAISNEFFSLTRVLEQAWNSDGLLSDRQKELIQSCLPQQVLDANNGAPTGEHELSDLHRVLSACDTIKSFEDRVSGHEENWLTSHGLEFPSAIRRYLHNAACRFNEGCPGILENHERVLPTDFQESLRRFILEEGANIATLNYDDLLYGCFAQTAVFDRRRLRDGFLGGKFSWEMSEHLCDERTEGWFLHLHGSPLFVDRNDEPTKITRAQLREFAGHESTHLVLTNVMYKPSVIQSSAILRTYWEKLERIVPLVENVVIFGYGGADHHLNGLLTRVKQDCKVKIVEYKDGCADQDRHSQWARKLAIPNFTLVRLENILEFTDWAN